MTQDLTLQGVPYALLHDGWWLSETGEPAKLPETPLPPSPPLPGAGTGWPMIRRVAAVALLLLVSLADFLFWHQRPGISIALFGLAAMAAVWVIARKDRTGGGGFLALAIALLSVLPVIERAQPLSVMFLVGGLLAFTTHAFLGPAASLPMLTHATLRLAAHLPWFSAWSLAQTARNLTARNLTARNLTARSLTARKDATSLFDRARHAWSMPLLVGLIFVWLFAAANPVIDQWLTRIFAGPWLSASAIKRILFWSTLDYLLWPLLSCPAIRPRLAVAPNARPVRPARALAGINPASVANSLVLFNLIFAVQTLLDLAYLWSGATLPTGMTHAEYAHRGAYPLIATALLAGAFALVSRPFTDGNQHLRALLALWIGQNLLLVISSLYRLDLYIDSYGLTYLRVAAAIWMGLVAAGLVLTFWQLWRGRSNGWLLARCLTLAVLSLYACTFVNFARIIAQTNLELYHQGSTADLDVPYLCSLDASAAGAIRDFGNETVKNLCVGLPVIEGPIVLGWRDWGFRSWRVQRYLKATQTAVTP